MLIVSSAFAAAQVQAYNDDEVLRYAKTIDVSQLDPALPSQPLEEWLLHGPAHIDQLHWEVSRSCDLKDPQPDADGDLPLCVRVAFRRGNARGLGSLRVGTLKYGVKGPATFEYLFSVVLFSVGDYLKLSDFPKYLDGIPKFGTLCILPLSFERKADPYAREYDRTKLKFKVDKEQELPWPQRQSVRIAPLDLMEEHAVVVTLGKERIQLFKFAFLDYSIDKLCLAFDGSQLAHLGKNGRDDWCSCK